MARIVAETAAGFERVQGPLIPLLHAVQDKIGWVPEEAIPLIASALNLSRADVHGVVSFYHDFRRHPPARHVVKFCRAEACRSRGAVDAERRISDRLGVAMNQTRADGHVALEAIYCLGLCTSGPNALVDGMPISRIDEARIEAIAGEIAA